VKTKVSIVAGFFLPIWIIKKEVIMSAITLTERNFDEVVKQSNLPVLVSYQDNNDVESLEKVSNDLRGILKCCRINVGTNPGLASRYKIRSIPTILLFNDGEVTDTIVGSVKTEQLMRILQ
jgi:thioredoxin 1